MSAIDLSRLNESQREVVRRLDEPLFVAEGAGSGKTFTLTARLVYALSEGSAADGGRYLDSIDQALVITFTKAAAAEIKDRVRSELRRAGAEDPKLYQESLRVDEAWISTIHGMCSRILKRHGVELGLDPDFQVAEESVAQALLARALDEVLTDAMHDETYNDLLAEFPLWGKGTGDALSVAGMIVALRTEAARCERGFDDLKCPQSNEFASAMTRVRSCFDALGAQRLTEKQAEVYVASDAALNDYFDVPTPSRTPSLAAECLANVKVPPRLTRADIKPLKAEADAALDEAVVIAHYERVQGFAPLLVGLARRVEERYASLKRDLSLLDNDDLIECALAAVRDNPEVTADLCGRFRLVMIDEFQDTDDKQLALVSLLSGESARHLTTVGDAQQSIYRFRGADVGVFRSRGASLDESRHVRMDVNYRSDHHVLALVERVCADTGILRDFLKLAGCATRRGRFLAKDADGNPPSRAYLEVVTGAPSDWESATCAAQIADRMRQLADAGQDVGSMALLLGRTSKVSFYLDALRARGLPAVVAGGSSFSRTPEVGVMQALLHTLANPHDTDSGLFRLLASDMFRLDANDFLQLGTMTQESSESPCKRSIEMPFLDERIELFDNARPSARLACAHRVLRRAFGSLGRLPLADICQQVVEESGWLSRLEDAGPDGLSVAANVLASIRYIRELTESLGLGVVRAATEFDQWLASAKLTPKSLSGDTVEAVRVMTIHGSKGLQFGVCAVAECWGNPDNKSRLSIGKVGDEHIVCVSPRPADKNFSKRKGNLEVPESARECTNVVDWSLMLDAADLEAQAQEKARLLYVALTRAEEAIIVGIPVANRKQYLSQLGMTVLGAFPEIEGLEPGETTISVEPEAGIECEGPAGDGVGMVRRRMEVTPAVARVVELRKGVAEDDPWQAFSCHTLSGFDGELPTSVTLVPQVGATVGLADETAPFKLFDIERREVAAFRWDLREGIYSYSSVAAKELAQERAQASVDEVAFEEEKHAPRDSDKATALGSCFHGLAQTMIETKASVTFERADELARTWRLSERQRGRLRNALETWEHSELRREALSYPVVRAEVPFFCPTPDSEHGQYLEGAIDLLCTQGFGPGGTALVVDYKTGDLGLGEDEVRERHALQAQLYASVLLSQGFDHVSCAFIAVETGVVARYEFDAA